MNCFVCRGGRRIENDLIGQGDKFESWITPNSAAHTHTHTHTHTHIHTPTHFPFLDSMCFGLVLNPTCTMRKKKWKLGNLIKTILSKIFSSQVFALNCWDVLSTWDNYYFHFPNLGDSVKIFVLVSVSKFIYCVGQHIDKPKLELTWVC